jgi:nitroimidazol reductase NimA-like FMN-containing flavoprotein (pyridoxamine 5'-phosphate oxidase superfamily)
MSTDAFPESNVVSMNESQIRTLLEEEGVGILALPAEDLPYTIPMSFGYDGDSMLYFAFLLFGTESQKEDLANRADRARFLVYRAESVYDWQSVSLTGHISTVRDEDGNGFENAMQNAWHPNLISSAHPMRAYRFEIESWTGIQQQDELEK